jgi:hypothetical protein
MPSIWSTATSSWCEERRPAALVLTPLKVITKIPDQAVVLVTLLLTCAVVDPALDVAAAGVAAVAADAEEPFTPASPSESW